ncbi:hypothetical protein P879_04178 [Paragonimus westermani]|uniref:Neuroglian n=1 Tax=Paragonimus westermani TaxID=34504 RepID=A0A8T0DMI5_9TREM|nr:hypothetical protein P879_04178 [Paragonimus westermani]
MYSTCDFRYVWYKNGKVFNWAANTGRYTKWPDQGTLVIARPGTDDDGIYQCIAENQFGVAQSNTINVKRAELGNFDQYATKIVVAQYGEPVQLPCNVPLGYPPPVVTWQTEKNAQIQYIKETNRRATDINGYLYIAAVIQEDHNTLYTCVANNEVLRHQKNGPSYRLQVYGQQTNYKLTTLYRTPRTEVTVVGDVLRLKCIYSGFPEPQYTWFKDGKEPIGLPNVVVKNLGTMLEINPVTLEAAGEYRCQGSNEQTLTTVNSQYTVLVQVPPTFTEKPEDVTVPVNGSVIFKCNASGIPAPQIRWTVNGQDPSSYVDGVRKILRGNMMLLYNLTIKDTAVIQCNASNAFGYDFVNAYVNVMREPPYFIKPPQSNHRVVDGHQVTLFCQTFSAPKAVISWTKDGRPINGGRYQNLPTGDLLISSVATTDSGVYECTATNPFGSRKASGRLLVRRRTSIVLAPIDTQVYENQVVKFVCTAETDPMELDNLRITWYKDDNLIMPEITPRIQKVWFDYSLVLSGAQPRDTGQYRCNASNGLDYAVASAALLVQGRPEQAIHVQVNCVEFINEELALVSWYPGSDNYAPIMEYIVEYSTQYERDTWYPAEIFNYTGLVQSTSIKVILRPSILYQFRIRTRNRVGISLPSAPTQTECGIPPRVPAINPSELYVYGSLRNNLIIRWTTLPYIEHYGSNLGYILTITCLNCDIIPRTAVNNTVIGDWRTDLITLTSFRVGVQVYEIETFKQFRVTIQSRNEKGVSTAQPTVALGYSGEAVPTITPPVPVVVNATPRGAVLRWQAISAAELPQVNGYFRGYRIEWCNATLDTAQCEAQFRFQDLILQIPPTPVLYSRRRRSVSDETYSSQHFVDQPIHEDDLDSDEYAVDAKHLKYRPQQSSQWRSFYERYNITVDSVKPSLSSVCHFYPKGNISCPGAGLFPRAAQSPSVVGEAYQATMTRQARQAQLPFENLMGGPRQPRFTLGQTINYTLVGVPGASTVRIWLRILNTRFAGPMGPAVTVTTMEDTPGPVANLQAVAVSVTYADIIWTPPSEPNGVVTGYEFEAKELQGLKMGFGFRYPALMNGTATGQRLTSLRPNTTYRITVWPMTSAGTGVDNFIDLTTAPSDVAPNAPNFVVTAVGLTNFTVLYEPSQRGIPGTVFFAQYRQPGVVLWIDSASTFSNRTIVVDSLTSDTSYEVRMVATNGAQLSTASAERLVHTLGGPGPGSLAGASGTWFIIVCMFLIAFIALLIFLILIRRRRLISIQKKSVGPDVQPLTTSPEYAQPMNVDEVTGSFLPGQPTYPPSQPEYRGVEQIQTNRFSEPIESDQEHWSPSEAEGGMSDFDEPVVRGHNSVRRLDDDADLVDERDFPDTSLRSNEEEAEMELDYSISPRESELASDLSYTHRRPAPSRAPRMPPRGYRSVPRAPSPMDSSANSHVSGDPTII